MHLCGTWRQVPLCPQPSPSAMESRVTTCLGHSGEAALALPLDWAGQSAIAVLSRDGERVEVSVLGEAATQGQPAPTAGKGARGSGNRAGEGSKSEEQRERGCFNPALVTTRGCGAGQKCCPSGKSHHCHQHLRSGWRDGERVPPSQPTSFPFLTLHFPRGGLRGSWHKRSSPLDQNHQICLCPSTPKPDPHPQG